MAVWICYEVSPCKEAGMVDWNSRREHQRSEYTLGHPSSSWQSAYPSQLPRLAHRQYSEAPHCTNLGISRCWEEAIRDRVGLTDICPGSGQSLRLCSNTFDLLLKPHLVARQYVIVLLSRPSMAPPTVSSSSCVLVSADFLRSSLILARVGSQSTFSRLRSAICPASLSTAAVSTT